MSTRLSSRHQPSGWNDRFDFPGGGFSEYLAHCRNKIAAARNAAGWQSNPEAIAMAAPYEISSSGAAHPGLRTGPPSGHSTPSRRLGVLLVHGLSDSPFAMADLARHFAERHGALTRTVLLPGHGTVPGDLLNANWPEWLRAVRYGIESFQDHTDGPVDRLYLAGFSAGAALILLAALEGTPVDGLFLFSPALRVSRLAPLAAMHPLTSWFRPESAWLHVHDDTDPAKYESFTKSAVVQVFRLTQALDRQLNQPLRQALTRQAPQSPNLPMRLPPLFVAQSQADASVSSAEVRRFFREETDPRNRMIWFGNGGDEPDDPRVMVLPDSAPALSDAGGRIISLAHGAVPIAPENPHYGRDGDYRDCLHYLNKGDDSSAERAAICQDDARFARDPRSAWGEKDRLSDRVLLRRLTYNPHFERMTAALDRFLENLG